MKWKLKIRNFGKIKEAEIHNSSLRFIVGHNNSGKSYLMTLLWGVEKITDYLYNLALSEQRIDLSSWISDEEYKQILSGEQLDFCLLDYIDIINRYINLILGETKDKIVSKLFNFEDVTIGELTFFIDADISDKFKIYKNGVAKNVFQISINNRQQQIIIADIDNYGMEQQKKTIFHSIVMTLLDSIFIGQNLKDGKAVYLPAARTGFLLTKDIINQTGRRIAFANEENKFEPFTMPIIEFLDIMDAIHTSETGKRYEKIINLIESKLLQGKLYVSDDPNKALRFTPDRTKEKLPLRTTSAVVTEVSPLYLLLKNYKLSYFIKSIYYEEPEMCLHPQLQQVIARVLIQLANTDVNLTVSTHSDVIVQHVNNMIRLGKSQNPEWMQRYGYENEDIIKDLDISMYQFSENDDGTTTLQELECGDYGFEVPVFNDALDKLSEEVYTLQEES